MFLFFEKPSSGMLPSPRIANLRVRSHYPSAAWNREGERETGEGWELRSSASQGSQPACRWMPAKRLILPVFDTASGLDGCARPVMAMASCCAWLVGSCLICVISENSNILIINYGVK